MIEKHYVTDIWKMEEDVVVFKIIHLIELCCLYQGDNKYALMHKS